MVLALGGSSFLAVLRRDYAYAVEDPKLTDDFGVLPMVQNFKLRAHRIFY